MKTHDVAIVGAGPAGSSLAYRLAREGFDVIVIDKESFPRKKICAGGLSPKVLKLLPCDITPVIQNEVFQVNITHKLRDEFVRSYEKVLIYTVNRARFDEFLVRQAELAGANVLTGTKGEKLLLDRDVHRVVATGTSITARIIVGADGPNSFVASSVGLQPFDRLQLALQVDIPMESNSSYTVDYGNSVSLDWGSIRSGYAWVFPHHDLLSVGAKAPLKFSGKLKRYHAAFLHQRGLHIEDSKVIGQIMPHRIATKPISRERVLLVGDAAGLADSWTGEGIFHALRSSQIAAGHIRRFLNGDHSALRDYEADVNRSIMPELRTSYCFCLLFDYVSRLAFKLIETCDYPTDLFFRIMRGDRTFLETRQRLRPDIFITKLLIKKKRAQ